MTARNFQRTAFVLLSLGLALGATTTDSFASKSVTKTEKHSTKKSREVAAPVAVSGDIQTAIHAQVKALADALAAGDAQKIASLWTEHGLYTDEDGAIYEGRTSIEKRFTAIFNNNGKQVVNFVEKPIAALDTNVAVEEGVVTRPAEDGKPQTRYTMLFVKQPDGVWLISRATETGFNAETSTANPLQDLNWLIGEWKAERDGRSVKMKAEWTTNNKFITCNFETKQTASDTPRESRQVIGWDPRTNQPVSWMFDNAGGFGHGDWVKEKTSWMIQQTNIDRAGNQSEATDIFKMTSPDAFTWQSINRSINGLSYNDSGVLNIVRVSQ